MNENGKSYIIGDLHGCSDMLEEMLGMHRNLETDVFYPWFDESLDLKERERVLKLLKNKKGN